jgi:phospholipid/cholesterol/gamma-HCH transport system ATP-binding protein
MALIELRNISKRFGHLVVLNNLSLSIEEGQSIVILGASGSGKSVMLKHIVGLLKPDAGEVWFAGQRIDNLPERQLTRVRQRFGFLFQMGALFDSLTVEENIGFPVVEHTHKPPEEVAKIVKQKLAMIGLPDVGKKMPARAIALDPEVILYDEPTTGLDPIRSDVINELIIKLKKSMKVTSIVVTHDMQSAFKVADRMVMLHEGRILIDGTPDDLRNSDNEIVKRFVAGEATDEELAGLERS